MPETTPPEPDPALRASDQERDAVLAQLAEQAAVGRLTLAEHEERADQALAARTVGELEALTTDLPQTAAVEPSAPERRVTRWMVAIMGGSRRRGRFRLRGHVNVVSVMGGDDIDLRDAEIEGGEITLRVISVMGGASIYLPDTVDVEVGGFSVMGGDNERGARARPRPGAPVVRIRSYNLMGGSDIWRLPAEARGLGLKKARRMAKEIERGG